jgi:cell division protein FtsN
LITPVEDKDHYNTETEEQAAVSQLSQPSQELRKPEEPQNTPQAQQPKEDRIAQDTQRTVSSEASQPKPAKDTREPQAPRERKAAKSAQESQKTSKAKRYTVQAGAFKNPSDADSLNAKFVKKGYKSFTRVSKTKNQEKLYKVMVGEFGTRDEAEVFSIKLRRSEGLRTFVTLAPGQEAIRQP